LQDFAGAFAAIERDDLGALDSLLTGEPALANAADAKGNSLLNLAVSLRRARAVESLLAAGARTADANIHGWTPLHQAAYLNEPALIERLLHAGAPVDAEARGTGGTPLIAALFWGHREAAALLAARGLTPRNLRTAAGAGDVAALRACFDANGALTTEAGSARGFYRPHSGFPEWTASNRSEEVLDEAVAWAARNDQAAVIGVLADAGASLDRDVYRGTPLAWAAAKGAVAAATELLDRGAGVNARSTFGGATHGRDVTPLHLAAEGGHTAMIELLLARGADRSARDANYQATPAEWAKHAGKTFEG
jgi:ankyrin repeat protein